MFEDTVLFISSKISLNYTLILAHLSHDAAAVEEDESVLLVGPEPKG